jgi:protein ImuB
LILTLRQIGIEKVEHLLALRRESLLARYGEIILRRIDQALGREAESFAPLWFAEPLAVRREFDGAATQLEAVTLTVQALLEELTPHLLERESGVRGLRLELARAHAPPVSLEILLGRPNRSARHLWSLLRAKVEAMHLGHGVEAVTLTAFWCEPIRHGQMEAWGHWESAEDQAIEELLDTLVNRWGSGRVLEARVGESHAPEGVRQLAPIRRDKTSRRPAPKLLLLADRPSLLLALPEPMEAIALQPDHPPSWLRWRGEAHALPAGAGPERIVTSWWSGQISSARYYYKVQTDRGLCLWVFREIASARWFVHGLWT